MIVGEGSFATVVKGLVLRFRWRVYFGKLFSLIGSFCIASCAARRQRCVMKMRGRQAEGRKPERQGKVPPDDSDCACRVLLVQTDDSK